MKKGRKEKVLRERKDKQGLIIQLKDKKVNRVFQVVQVIREMKVIKVIKEIKVLKEMIILQRDQKENHLL